MADVGIWCKNANIIARAGANVSATSAATAWTDTIVLDCESLVNAITRYNWSDAYSTLNVDVKYVLMDAAASLAAMLVINYDMSGFPSREAETRLDFLRDCFERDIQLLKDIKARDFVENA